MKKEYSTIQLEKDVKKKLTEYCEKNGYKISGFLRKIILQTLGENNG